MISRKPFPGGWFCDAGPHGELAVILSDHVLTHLGTIPLTPEGWPVYIRLSVSGRKFAGQGHEVPGHPSAPTSAWEWDFDAGGGWRAVDPVVIGTSPVIYKGEQLLVSHGGSVGAQGYWFVAPDGYVWTGDQCQYRSDVGLYNWTELGDVIIGQGPNGGAILVHHGTRYVLEPGDTRWIRFTRDGDQLGFAMVKDQGQASMSAVVIHMTVADIPSLPKDVYTFPPVPPFDHPLGFGYFYATSDMYGDNPAAQAIETCEIVVEPGATDDTGHVVALRADGTTPVERCPVPMILAWHLAARARDSGRWDQVFALWLDRPWDKMREEVLNAQWFVQSLGLPPKPILAYIDGPDEWRGPIEGVTWSGVQAYQLKWESNDAFLARANRNAQRAGGEIAWIGQSYDTNDAQTMNLPPLQPMLVGLARNPLSRFLFLFSDGRQFRDGSRGGVRVHEELRPYHRDIYVRAKAVGLPDPGPVEDDMKQPEVTMTNPVPKVTKSGWKVEVFDTQNKQKVVITTEIHPQTGQPSFYAQWVAEGFEVKKTGASRPVVLDCPDGGGGGGTELKVTCPGNVSATSTDGKPMAVTFPAPTASGGTAPYTVSTEPASGSTFPVGSTTVTGRATDSAGKTATCQFSVVVRDGSIVVPEKFRLRRHDLAEAFVGVKDGLLHSDARGGAMFYDKAQKGLNYNGSYIACEQQGSQWVLVPNRVSVGEWELCAEQPNADGTVSYRFQRNGKLMRMTDEGPIFADAQVARGQENFVKEQVASGVANGLKGQVYMGGAKGKQPMDDTGPRRILGFYDLSILRTCRLYPDVFERRLDMFAEAGIQVVQGLTCVGGNEAWAGREINRNDITNSRGDRIPGWPDFDEVLRRFLESLKARGMYAAFSSGDMYCMHANPQEEIDMEDQIAAVCASVYPKGILSKECHNEYGLAGTTASGNRWGNSIYGDNDPPERDQDQRIMDVWKRHIPGILTLRGSLNSEEPDALLRSCSIGDLCGIHGEREWPKCMKRASGRYYWEGHPGSFPKQYFENEPGGLNKPNPDGSIPSRGFVFAGWTNVNMMVGMYAMLTLNGSPLFMFNGTSLQSEEPPDSCYGFWTMPKLLSVVPEDIASWGGAANSAVGGIWYWSKGEDVLAATCEGWNNTPPWPLREWTMYSLSNDGSQIQEERGSGNPRTLNPGEYGRLIAGKRA